MTVGPTSDPAPRRRPAWTLRRYLMLIMMLFLLSAIMGSWYGWTRAEADAVDAAREDAGYGVRLGTARIAEGISVVRATVHAVAGNPGLGHPDCQLSFTVGGGSEDGHIDLVDAGGTVRCSSRARDGTGYAGAAWLPTALRQPHLAAPVHDSRTGRPALAISEPVPGIGAVVAFVDLAAFGAAIGEQFGGPRQLTFTISTTATATVVTRWPEPEKWIGTVLRSPPDSSTSGVATLDAPGWRVEATADRTRAVAGARRLILRQSLVVGAGLLIGLPAMIIVYRRVARPIDRLRATVRAAPAGGDPVPVSGPREVAELGEEFNRLVDTVRRELDDRRRAEETARQLFARNPFPMLVFDAETLTVVDANDAALEFYGLTRDEIHALPAANLCPEEDAATVAEVLSATGRVERCGPVRQVRHDGTTADVIITSHPLAGNGRWLRCALIEDVTEREHLERRLRQSQRLESLGQLAGGVAHDFNNLLGIILGYAEMAAADVAPVAQADPAWRPLHDDLIQIVQAGDRATGLTRQLLAFARAEVTAPQVLDLNAVVRDIEKLLRRTLGEDVQLLVDLSGDETCVLADPGQLEQVLVNLCVNARDAMPTGGTLTVATDAVDVDEHYAGQHPGLRIGRYARLRISDTGSGMDQETQDRAFEPFFTTKPKGQGTGLGLATIYGIVTQAGGDVRIYSEIGLGTTITALLPATTQPAAVADPAPDQHGPGRGETILLAEDEDDLRGLTERVLTRNNYAVVVLCSAAEAIQVADSDQHVDLLLTDVVMPEVDGHTLANRLRALRPTLPVIYMSGYTETVLATRSTLPPGSTLLTKPVTAHQLLAAVRRALDSATSDTYSERR